MNPRKKQKQKKQAKFKLALDNGQIYQWLIGLATFVLIAVIVLIDMVPKLDLTVGSVAPETIYAPRTIRNNYATSLLERQAAEEAARQASQDPNNYDINTVVGLEATEDILALLELVKDKRQSLGLWTVETEETGEGTEEAIPETVPQLPTGADVDEVQNKALEQLGLRLTDRLTEVLLLLPAQTLSEGMTGLAQIVGDFLQRERISEADVPAKRNQLVALILDSSLPEEFIPEAQEIAANLCSPT